MKSELFWLTATALMTTLFWIPYIGDRIMKLGVRRTLQNPDFSKLPQAAWAGRMRQAHHNAVENLAVFAPLVLVAALKGNLIGRSPLRVNCISMPE